MHGYTFLIRPRLHPSATFREHFREHSCEHYNITDMWSTYTQLDVFLLLLANKHFSFQDCIQYTTPHLSFKQYVTNFANIYVTVLQRIICFYFGQISSQTFSYISWTFSRTFSWTLQQNRHVTYIHPAWRFSFSLSKQTFFQDCIQYTTPHLSFKQYVTNFANIYVTVLQRIIFLSHFAIIFQFSVSKRLCTSTSWNCYVWFNTKSDHFREHLSNKSTIPYNFKLVYSFVTNIFANISNIYPFFYAFKKKAQLYK
jgi:hypothetical protein